MNLYRGLSAPVYLLRLALRVLPDEDFDHEVLIKANAIELLRHELAGNA